MGYCPTCGRQRNSNGRYCGGCGRDFGVAGAAASPVPVAEPLPVPEGVPVAEPLPFAEPVTEAVPVADPARLEPPTAEPTKTVPVTAGRPKMPPPPPPPPASPGSASPGWASAGPADLGEGGRQSRGPGLWIAVAVAVLLAVGGGTYALVRNADQRPAAGGGGAPAVTAGTTAPPTQAASTQPSASPTLSASPSSTASAAPSPSVSPSVVSIGPAVTDASPQVEVVLSHYFQGINDRDYAEYASSQTAQGKADQPESSFAAGYATTTDTDMTLTSLTPTGGGDLTSTVTFTSHQSPSDSVDDSACNDWTLNLYLVPSGAGYLIAPAPPSYEPSYSDC